MKKQTPWGYAQHVREIAPGIISHSTASHGGLELNQERWSEFRKVFPAFKPWAGDGWLEEDCDCVLAPLVWPDLFGDEQVFHSVDFALTPLTPGDYMKEPREWLLSPAGAEVLARHERFKAAVADQWIQCGGMSMDAGWSFHYRRVSDGTMRTVGSVDYPPKSMFTGIELDQMQVEYDEAVRKLEAAKAVRQYQRHKPAVPFDEFQCSGAFDGNTVTSDCDSGL